MGVRWTMTKYIAVMLTAVNLFLMTMVWKQNDYMRVEKCGCLQRDGPVNTMTPRTEATIEILRDRKVASNTVKMERGDDEALSRDATWQEDWPEVEGEGPASPHMPSSVHYLWCGADRHFTFQDYLGVLSGLRVMRPLKIIFHYTHNLPVQDKHLYNDWYLVKELLETVPLLDLQQLAGNHTCGSQELKASMVKIVMKGGGVYLDENVILARRPLLFVNGSTMWSAARRRLTGRGLTPGLVLVKPRLDTGRIYGNPAILQDTYVGDSTCVTLDAFNKEGPGQGRECITLDPAGSLHPRDIWDSDTPFGELARWLFYGKRAVQLVKPDYSRPIPRISHFIRIPSNEYSMYTDQVSFPHFIGILSALYIAGFEQVYLHTTQEPSGPWWEELRGENITVVKLQKPDKVFQQKVTWIKHVSDLSRYHVVHKYGGAYQDFDVVWTSYLPGSLLAYPAIISPDISANGLWPDGLSIGLFLARARAPFLRHFMKTYKKYVNSMPLYNSIKMSYRTKERYPSTIRVDNHLQMICFRRFCHPLWTDSRLDLYERESRNFNWTQIHCIHVTSPKPATSYTSPAFLKNGTDIFADIGRWVLKKSGRIRLLDHNPAAAPKHNISTQKSNLWRA